jgi:hypothetical protein
MSSIEIFEDEVELLETVNKHMQIQKKSERALLMFTSKKMFCCNLWNLISVLNHYKERFKCIGTLEMFYRTKKI